MAGKPALLAGNRADDHKVAVEEACDAFPRSTKAPKPVAPREYSGLKPDARGRECVRMEGTAMSHRPDEPMTPSASASPHSPSRLHRRRLLQGAAGTAAVAALPRHLSAQSTPAAAGTPAPAVTPTANTAASGQIRYQLVSSDPGEIQRTQALLDQLFTPMYPNITVTVEPQPENREEALVTAMVGGNAPDVFDTWRDDVAQYDAVGQVLDVQSLVQRDFTADAIADYFAWQWADFILPSGIRFGLPKYVNMMAVWYNKDAFAQAGLSAPDDTWNHDTYADAARKLTVKNGEDVSRWGLFFPSYAIDRFAYKLTAFGGSLVDPNDPKTATFGDDPALAASQWLYDLTFKDHANAEFGLIFPGGSGGVANTTIAFAQGKVAMVEDGLYPFAIAEQVKQAGAPFTWGFAPVPAGPAGRHVLGTADGFAIWGGSSNQDAAWELTKFLSGPAFQLESTKITGYLPCRYSLLDSWISTCVAAYPELADADLELARTAMDQGYPRNRPLFARDADAQSLITPALQAVFATGDEEPSYLKDVAQQVTDQQHQS